MKHLCHAIANEKNLSCKTRLWRAIDQLSRLHNPNLNSFLTNGGYEILNLEFKNLTNLNQNSMFQNEKEQSNHQKLFRVLCLVYTHAFCMCVCVCFVCVFGCALLRPV